MQYNLRVGHFSDFFFCYHSVTGIQWFVFIRPQREIFLFLIPHTISLKNPLKNTIQICMNIFAFNFSFCTSKKHKLNGEEENDEKLKKHKSIFSDKRNIF